MLLELEKEENYLISSEQNLGVLCPICQKHTLNISREEGSHQFSCACGQKISFNGDLNELSFKINKSVIEHENKSCSEILIFFVEPIGNADVLSFFCTNCDFYGSI